MVPVYEKCRNREHAEARQQQYRAAGRRLSFWFWVFFERYLLPLRVMVTIRQASAYVLRN